MQDAVDVRRSMQEMLKLRIDTAKIVDKLNKDFKKDRLLEREQVEKAVAAINDTLDKQEKLLLAEPFQGEEHLKDVLSVQIAIEAWESTNKVRGKLDEVRQVLQTLLTVDGDKAACDALIAHVQGVLTNVNSMYEQNTADEKELADLEIYPKLLSAIQGEVDIMADRNLFMGVSAINPLLAFMINSKDLKVRDTAKADITANIGTASDNAIANINTTADVEASSTADTIEKIAATSNDVTKKDEKQNSLLENVVEVDLFSNLDEVNDKDTQVSAYSEQKQANTEVKEATEAKADTVVQAEAEIKTDIVVQVETETKAEYVVQAETETKAESVVQAETGTKAESTAKVEPKTQAKARPSAKAKSKAAKSKVETTVEAKADAKAKANVEADAAKTEETAEEEKYKPGLIPTSYKLPEITIDATDNCHDVITRRKFDKDRSKWRCPVIFTEMLFEEMGPLAGITLKHMEHKAPKIARANNFSSYMSNTIEYYKAKGYVQAIHNDVLGDAYGITMKGISGTRMNIKHPKTDKVINVSDFGKFTTAMEEFDGGAAMDVAQLVTARLRDFMDEALPKDEDYVDEYHSGYGFYCGSYTTDSVLELPPNVLVVGNFSTLAMTYDMIQKYIDKALKGAPVFFVFTSFDLEYAGKLADHYKELLSIDGVVKFYLYSPQKNMIYSYPRKRPIKDLFANVVKAIAADAKIKLKDFDETDDDSKDEAEAEDEAEGDVQPAAGDEAKDDVQPAAGDEAKDDVQPAAGYKAKDGIKSVDSTVDTSAMAEPESVVENKPTDEAADIKTVSTKKNTKAVKVKKAKAPMAESEAVGEVKAIAKAEAGKDDTPTAEIAVNKDDKNIAKADSAIETENTVAAEPAVESETVAEAEPPVEVQRSSLFEADAPKMDIAVQDNAEMEVRDDAIKQVFQLLIGGQSYCAMAYMRAMASNDDICHQLAYALHDPQEHCEYNSSKLFQVFSTDSGIAGYLKLAAALRTFFYDQYKYDYELQGLMDTMDNIDFIASGECNEIKDIMFTLMKFKQDYSCGMDSFADFRMRDAHRLEEYLDILVDEAKDLHQTISTPVRLKASFIRYVRTMELMVGPDSDINNLVLDIVNRKRDSETIELMRSFVEENFIKEGTALTAENISQEKMDAFIEVYWDKAEDMIRLKMRNKKLMGSFHQSAESKVYKSVDLFCRWIDAVCSGQNSMQSEAAVAYKRQRGKLLKDMQTVITYLANAEHASDEEAAGAEVLFEVIYELQQRMLGKYIEGSARYFYIDFLKSNYVLLDDNYLPVINNAYNNIRGISFGDRVVAHSKAKLCTFPERLSNIFDTEDDYGSAQLIYGFMNAVDTGEKVERNNIEGILPIAEQRARRRYNDFIEQLELMECKGQIDNLSHDTNKDLIQQSIEQAFDEAITSHNFGFFSKVCKAYEAQIMSNARKIGTRLEQDLNRVIKEHNSNDMDNAEMAARLNQIKEDIASQDYTIAEDRLAKLNEPDWDMTTEAITKDYLVDFEDNFNQLYSSVRRGLVFSVKGQSNKNKQGASQLGECWPNGTAMIGTEKVKRLMLALELGSANVTDDNAKRRLEDCNRLAIYSVRLAKTPGMNTVYKHPIAAFGSGAMAKDFKVIALIGNNSVDNLCTVFERYSGNRNVMVLLDWAMTMADRRKLAKAVKLMNSESALVVVDKVIMQYLINNYERDCMSSMLMSLVMPYSYYQPYVWDSMKPMPPEIFIGRQDELKRIESPSGVNLVYGGRQLGKSALLRKACSNINGNSEGDRAIYIEIKDMDSKQAATYIGHELHDNGILAEDLPEYDWDNLSRLIKKRLMQENDRIPYLLLLLDEGDAFIASCAEDGYRAFDKLKSIQQGVGEGRFKFVVAGLHNIIRFSRGSALGNNRVITQMQALTVTPFSTAEGRELIRIPLHYMGIRFPKGKEKIVDLILATANYFPGLIQLYCWKLMEAMTRSDYAGYEEVNTPHYNINEKHIQKVLNDEEFKHQIQEKLEITLSLDKDNYYYAIALVLARLYHENSDENLQLFTPEAIIAEGNSCGVDRVGGLTADRLCAYLDELCDLNILKKNNSNMYSFKRYHFYQMMGNVDEIDDKLAEYM